MPCCRTGYKLISSPAGGPPFRPKLGSRLPCALCLAPRASRMGISPVPRWYTLDTTFRQRSMAMTHRFFLLTLLLASLAAAAQTGVDQNLQSAVAAGNQAWIDGMRSGNTGIIAAIYADDAVGCTAEGQCVFGASAVEQQIRSRLASRSEEHTSELQSPKDLVCRLLL